MPPAPLSRLEIVASLAYSALTPALLDLSQDRRVEDCGEAVRQAFRQQTAVSRVDHAHFRRGAKRCPMTFPSYRPLSFPWGWGAGTTD